MYSYPRPPRPAEERFWEKVNKDGPIPTLHPELGNCWEWTAFAKPGAYGLFRAVSGKSSVHAHKFSYELECGPVERGKVVDHLCHNKICVRPSHLVAVTQGDNMSHTEKHCTLLASKGNHYQ